MKLWMIGIEPMNFATSTLIHMIIMHINNLCLMTLIVSQIKWHIWCLYMKIRSYIYKVFLRKLVKSLDGIKCNFLNWKMQMCFFLIVLEKLMIKKLINSYRQVKDCILEQRVLIFVNVKQVICNLFTFFMIFNLINNLFFNSSLLFKN